MYIVGLTGGIGSGKTAASDYFQTLGIDVVDADICARLVVEKGQSALESISQRFGAGILTDQGELNRAALRQIIFSQPAEKQWLEALLHPLIAQTLNQQLANSKSAYTLLVSPLLTESQQYLLCDRILVIDVPEELQIQRASQRDNNSAEQIKQILQKQHSREKRLSFAHDVISNDQDIKRLQQAIDLLHKNYLQYAKDKQQGH